MNSWRLDRNTDGRKIGKTAWIALLAGEVAFDKESDVELPFEERNRKFANVRPREKSEAVQVIPRFLSDLQALKILFGQNSPPLRLIRGIKISSVICGFGDASGGGFGSS